jgi:hypothetical protein
MLNNKKDIKLWLEEYNIKNYIINGDLTVDVFQDVDIGNRKLNEIPVKFNIVNGDFYCDSNKLSSLKDCPKEVSGDFVCTHNKLTSLDYLPRVNINSVYSDFPKKYVLDFFIKNRPEDLI